MSYEINQQFIPGLPTDPLDYIGVVAHSTADPGASAQNIATYFANNWQSVSAFTHFVVDKDQIIQLAPVTIQCWGAGQTANKSYVQVELCEYKDAADAKKAYEKYCWLIAKLLFDKKLGVSENITLLSHAEVSARWKETDHTDPLSYLGTVGLSWQDVVNGVTWDYADMLKSKQPVSANIAPTEKTPIQGKSVATVEQMRLYLKQKNPHAPDYAQLYLTIGDKYGISGDKVFCQSLHETGDFKFGGQVKSNQNNFCGLGALNGGAAGATFATPAQGIEAQFQHLYGYMTTVDLPKGTVVLDPRFALLAVAKKRGIAPNWEDLNGKWAVPGVGYGESVLAMWKEMYAIVVPPVDPNQWKADIMQWMTDQKLITVTHDPDSTPTYAELGVILQRLSTIKGGN